MSDEATITAPEAADNTGQSEESAILAPPVSEETTAQTTTEENSAVVAEETSPSILDPGTIETEEVLESEKKEGEETVAEETPDEVVEPIVYEEFNLPEGFEMNQPLLDKMTPILSKLNVDQEGAQTLVDAFTEMNTVAAQEAQDKTTNTVNAWKKSITDDEAYKENLPLAQKGIARLVQEHPDIKDLFSDPVFGNMPQLFKIASFIGKHIESEATLLTNGQHGNNKGTFLDKMYPSMNE